jgi:hypothetical protein
LSENLISFNNKWLENKIVVKTINGFLSDEKIPIKKADIRIKFKINAPLFEYSIMVGTTNTATINMKSNVKKLASSIQYFLNFIICLLINQAFKSPFLNPTKIHNSNTI